MYSVTGFFKTLFSPLGLGIAVYLIIGVMTNTASPHVPTFNGNNFSTSLHSFVQYGISVFFWPFHLWQGGFTTGKWTP